MCMHTTYLHDGIAVVVGAEEQTPLILMTILDFSMRMRTTLPA